MTVFFNSSQLIIIASHILFISSNHNFANEIPLDLLKDLSDFLQPFKVSNRCISSISEYG